MIETKPRIDWQNLKAVVPEGQHGEWRVEQFVIPEDETDLYNMRLLFSGYGSRRVKPGTYTRLIRGHMFDPMMSDTPAEIRDCLPLFRALENHGGRVLMNGLGLGLTVQAALSLPTVEHIDVVEIESDIISLVAPHYSDPRLTIHEGDALTYKFPKGTRWNVVWHDIWPSICGDNAEAMGRLNRRYGRRCNWQGAWCANDVKRENRRSTWW